LYDLQGESVKLGFGVGVTVWNTCLQMRVPKGCPHRRARDPHLRASCLLAPSRTLLEADRGLLKRPWSLHLGSPRTAYGVCCGSEFEEEEEEEEVPRWLTRRDASSTTT
jgi:hypothetical protein